MSWFRFWTGEKEKGVVLDIVSKVSVFSFDNDTIISYRNYFGTKSITLTLTINDNSITIRYNDKKRNAPRGHGTPRQTRGEKEHPTAPASS